MKKFFLALLMIPLAGFLLLGYFVYRCRTYQPEWVTQTADRGEIKNIVKVMGTLLPLDKVDVSCQIGGVVSSLSVDFNSTVKEGQLLAQIDPVMYQIKLDRAKANLESFDLSKKKQQTQLTRLEASLDCVEIEIQAMEASLKKGEIAVEMAKRQTQRLSELLKKKMIPQADHDDAISKLAMEKIEQDKSRLNLKAMKSKKLSAEAELEAFRIDLKIEEIKRRQIESELDEANTNLARTLILSPVDGIVLSRRVSIGETIGVGLQAPTIFTIARDLKHMRIQSLVDETDLYQIREGLPASFSVKAFPDRRFPGTVRQIRLSPESEKETKFLVIIDVDNRDLTLKPGLSANVEIETENHSDVLRIPTEAAYFLPSKEILARFSHPTENKTASEATNIWILNENSEIQPMKIQTLISNAQYTEVQGTPFPQGTKIVVAEKVWWLKWLQGR